MHPEQRYSGYHNVSPSHVWRSVQFIDQTVNEAASLAEAAVLASIRADYDRGMASGGRYYGDTVPANPSGIDA